MVIRPATEADLEAMSAIYNNEVLTGTSTMDTEPRDERRQREWFESHASAAYPVLVAVEAGLVVGWASLSPWSPRGGYSQTVEASLFVRQDDRGRGVGRQLVARLVHAARKAGHRVVLCRIAATNERSRKLAASSGFRSVGVMHRVGKKLGRTVDIELFELLLDEEGVDL